MANTEIDLAKPELPKVSSVVKAEKKSRAHTRYYTTDGVLVPGVTTVLGVMNKPALVKWANELGLRGVDSTKYVDALARIGSLIHYLVECDCLGEDPDLSDYTPNELEAAKVGYRKWIEWKSQHEVEVLGNELELVSSEHLYGGKCDIYARVDGVLTLLDIKTSKACYSEQRTQVVAYGPLLRENGKPVDAYRIIRIGRNENEGFEDVHVGAVDAHWAVFKACLALYQAQRNLKNVE